MILRRWVTGCLLVTHNLSHPPGNEPLPHPTRSVRRAGGFVLTGYSEVILKVRFADNTGVEQLDQNCAVRKDLPLRLAGWFRHNGQYEVAEQVRSWGPLPV